MAKQKQIEEVWKSDIRVDEHFGMVLDSFIASHGADSALLETLTCQAPGCGVSSSVREAEPDTPGRIQCPNCHSHDVIITEVRLFTNVEGV